MSTLDTAKTNKISFGDVHLKQQITQVKSFAFLKEYASSILHFMYKEVSMTTCAFWHCWVRILTGNEKIKEYSEWRNNYKQTVLQLFLNSNPQSRLAQQVSLKCERLDSGFPRLSLFIRFYSHILLLNSTCPMNATLASPQHHMTNRLTPIYSQLSLYYLKCWVI